MSSPSNPDIRREIRQKRRALSAHQQTIHARQLSRQISRCERFRNCNRVALYLANDGEIDPTGAINLAWKMGKEVYLPVLSPLKDQLYFSRYTAGMRMRNNRFDIYEPDSTPRQWLTAQQVDLLFLPLVAFDGFGNRLGMGGGFYDRTLAYLRRRRAIKKPHLIGLAHELQYVKKISSEPWDIPLETIITERRIIRA